jgi:uncharacterized protein
MPDFFVYSRDAARTAALRDDEELLERHWSYMDGFAATMIARGPTLDAARERPTGSLHVLGLPSVAAAHEFVAREPNNCAGVYAEHSILRFENLLGRTMWEFAGADPAQRRFLVVARVRDDRPAGERRAPVPPERLSAPLRERLILYGLLSSLDRATLVGIALALQTPDRASLDALLGDERLRLDGFPDLEVDDWEFGGRD